MKTNVLGYTAADYNRRTPPAVIRPVLVVAAIATVLAVAIRLLG